MSLLDKTVLEFIHQVDSKEPAPGGGSVSALSSVLGVSLARMVGHLTIGRKAYRSLPEEHQEMVRQSFYTLGEIKDELLPLIDKDTEAFNQIMTAYRLPKDTDDDKANRLRAIEAATVEAINVPMQVACLSIDALKQLPPLLHYGNKNALSDVKVAALELATGCQGALFNVEINVPGLTDADLQQKFLEQAESIRHELGQNLYPLQ